MTGKPNRERAIACCDGRMSNELPKQGYGRRKDYRADQKRYGGATAEKYHLEGRKKSLFPLIHGDFSYRYPKQYSDTILLYMEQHSYLKLPAFGKAEPVKTEPHCRRRCFRGQYFYHRKIGKTPPCWKTVCSQNAGENYRLGAANKKKEDMQLKVLMVEPDKSPL